MTQYREILRLYQHGISQRKARLCLEQMTYIFLDEIQKVDAFEKVVDSLVCAGLSSLCA